jgi:pyruvate dehydrogenase E1 component beta subunit
MALQTYSETIRNTLRDILIEDERVFLMGEDIGPYEGVFKATKGLVQEFGPDRVIDTPISEAGFVGLAVGAALYGLRPIVEIMFIDFALLIFDQLCNQAAKLRYMSGGQVEVPLVVRTNIGSRGGAAAQHSQSLHGMFTCFPGLKVVAPSDAADARGLLFSAVEDPNPVLFVENKQLYFVSEEVPEEHYRIPLGKAAVKRPGKDLTIVATSFMVNQSLKAADMLSGNGIAAEVVDPRTLAPLDKETILSSVAKTSRVLVVDEGVKMGGFAQQVASIIAEEGFWNLDAPVSVLAAPEIPIPYSPPLERVTQIKAEDIYYRALDVLEMGHAPPQVATSGQAR